MLWRPRRDVPSGFLDMKALGFLSLTDLGRCSTPFHCRCSLLSAGAGSSRSAHAQGPIAAAAIEHRTGGTVESMEGAPSFTSRILRHSVGEVRGSATS
jgi:hypothetical protein